MRAPFRDRGGIGAELAGYASGVRGYVRMSWNLSGIVEFLPEDLRAFQAQHERVKLDLEERPSGGVIEAVETAWSRSASAPRTRTRALHVEHYRHDTLVIALINTLGQVGGIVSPVMVGRVRDLTGRRRPRFI